jgi:ribonuclease P protein component
MRVSRGSLTLYLLPNPTKKGRLIVALGRTAGNAVTRSRVRRIARDVFGSTQECVKTAGCLLLARGDLGDEPRKRIRMTLETLFARGNEVLGRAMTDVS